jgi:hypothetical protein
MTVDVVDTTTGEIVPAFGGALTPEQATARAQWVRDVTKAALTVDVDYGKIPGTDKPSLFKSGAEMLLLAAGYGFTMDRSDDDDARQHRGVTYKCTVRRRDGSVVATCDGYAGFDESRFYVSAEDAERRERFNADKYRRPVNHARFVEYRAPWNTLVKMAEKRALVGAALNACAASGLFIADMDDVSQPDPVPGPDDPVPDPTSPPPAKASGSTKKAAAKPAAGRLGDELVSAFNALAQPGRAAFRTACRSAGWAWPPTDPTQYDAMTTELIRLRTEQDDDAETYGG